MTSLSWVMLMLLILLPQARSQSRIANDETALLQVHADTLTGAERAANSRKTVRAEPKEDDKEVAGQANITTTEPIWAKWLKPGIPLSAFGAVLPNASGRFAESPDQVESYLKWKIGQSAGDCASFECNEEFCLPMMTVLSQHGFNARVALFKEDTLVRYSEGWHSYGEPFPYHPSEWPRTLHDKMKSEYEYDVMKTADGEFSQCVEDYVTVKGLKPGTWPDEDQWVYLAKKGFPPASRRCIRLRSRKKGSSEEWPLAEACASCECHDFDEFPRQLQFTPY